MRASAALLAAVLLAGPPRAAAQDQAGASQAPVDPQLLKLQRRLATDPSAQGALAERIARSRLGDHITEKTDNIGRIADIQAWIRANPSAAAEMALGLAEDDANGDHQFEDMASQQAPTHLVANPGAQDNLFNQLRKAANDSKLMRSSDNANMADEEKSELLKRMFEGKGSESSKVLTQQPGNGGAGGVLNSGYYDRLGAGNLGGYSPQLQSLQSALNARRAPGAPKLIETGKLDYATLSYPGYGMRYDVDNLRLRLSYERAWALAKLLGREREFSRAQLSDPAMLAMLEKQAAGKGAQLSARFAKRQAALEKAEAALADFDGAALPAKDPLRITRRLLSSLGDKQREAARWITDAGLEEELQRLETEEGFLSPELDDQIERCPVAPDVKTAYRRRGQEYQKDLEGLKQGDQSAASALESDGWLDQLDAVEKTLDQCATLRKDFQERVSDYVATPYRLSSLVVDKPRWRQLVDQWWLKLLPATAYGRQLQSVQRELDLLKDVFGKIALGDLDAAHTILASTGAGPEPR